MDMRVTDLNQARRQAVWEDEGRNIEAAGGRICIPCLRGATAAHMSSPEHAAEIARPPHNR